MSRESPFTVRWPRNRDTKETTESWSKMGRGRRKFCLIKSAWCDSDVKAGKALRERDILLSLRILTNNSSPSACQGKYIDMYHFYFPSPVFSGSAQRTGRPFHGKQVGSVVLFPLTTDLITAVQLSLLLSAFSKVTSINNPHRNLQSVALPFSSSPPVNCSICTKQSVWLLDFKCHRGSSEPL